MSTGNTQAVERQSPVNEAQDSRTISIVSVNVDRLTSYKLRSLEEYALTADTNVLAIQEVGSKGAEYLERASFSRLNWFKTDISKNKDTEKEKNNILATYFNRNMDKEAEKVFDEDRILEIRQGFEEELAKLPPPNNTERQQRLNFQTFKSTIKKAVDNCIPLVAHEKLYRTSSDRTDTLFEIRRRLWKILTENESKILKKIIRKSTLSDYKTWLDLQVRRIDTAMAKNDIHEAFKQAERIVGKKRKPQRTITMEDGKYLNDKKRAKKTQLMGIVRRRKLKDKLSDTAIQQLVNKYTRTSSSRNLPSKDALVGYKAQCLGAGTVLVRSRKCTTAVAVAEQNFLYNNIPIEEELETNLGSIKGVKTFRYLGVDVTATADTHVNPFARIRAAQETLHKLQPILRNNMLAVRRKKNIVKALVNPITAENLRSPLEHFDATLEQYEACPLLHPPPPGESEPSPQQLSSQTKITNPISPSTIMND
eukprot:augustus_masked-scaffold_45-processed-gene-1.116-mRNA-1 protein AED:1.00 eAED:1.00 QI:0/0/0/0/1/1/4/0/479